MTPGQQDIWIASQFQPEAAAAFAHVLRVELRGPLDRVALEGSFQQKVARHPSLCARVTSDGQRFEQDPQVSLSLEKHDLTRISAAHLGGALEELLKRLMHPTWDLQKAPLAGFHLIELARDRHCLLCVAHQMACGATGLLELVRAWAAHYSATISGHPASEETAPAQDLAGFFQWTSSALGNRASASQQFWTKSLSPAPSPLDLPSFKTRPPEHSLDCETSGTFQDASLGNQLQAAANRAGLTEEAILLAAYAATLYRLTQQDDLCVGWHTHAAGLKPEFSRAFPSAVLLPLRIQVQPEETFADLAQKVQGTMRQAQDHCWLSFRDLLRSLQVARDASRPPLVAATFQHLPLLENQLFSGLELSSDWLQPSRFQYDLGIVISSSGSQLHHQWTGSQGIVDHAALVRWQKHFQELLRHALAQPEIKVGLLPLLSQEESRTILHDWNKADRNIGDIRTLHELITDCGRRWPDRIAVVSDGLQYTYRELESRSNQLANLLHRSGVERETPVAVCFERTAEVLVGLLAILKAGGVYVPVDPDAPADRTAYVLEHTEARVLLTHARLADRFKEGGYKLIRLDADWPEIAKEPSDLSFTAHSDPSQLCYILYTSGSTGKPKGVQLEHGNVVNFLVSMRDDLSVKPEDVFLALTTFTFDIAVLELYLPLIVGARTVVVPRSVVLEPDQLASALEKHRITILQATPTTWRMLFASGWKGIPGLVGLCGGEALPPDLAEKLIQACATPWNVYGPTETTVWSTAGVIRSQRTITLGDRLANTTLYVVDDRMQPVPIGVPGELLIGGWGVARGYRKNPELTSTKFVRDPFVQDPKARVFKTADQVRYHPNGQIEYLGRRDFQVKLRGYRIELGEIESVLIAHEAVKEAAVVLREDVAGQPHLAAYVVLKEPQSAPPEPIPSPRSADFKQFLAAKLPAYMLPAVYVEMAKLPQTLNGKLDRKALPAVKSTESGPTQEFVAPQGPTETRMAEIWSRLLKLPKVGSRDNYFDVGGQSVLAVTLFKEVEAVFGVKLPLATLFRAPTVAQLAAEVDRAQSPHHSPSDSWSSLVPISTQGSNPPLFLIHGAGGNVLLYQTLARHLAPDFPLYGLQSLGLDDTTKPLRTIEEMASHYIREIQSVQPHGPYFIGGYCMGGTVAYEMAQQLIRAGHQVPLIAMLDTYNFSRALKRDSSASLAQRLRFHVSNFLQLRPRDVIAYVREKFRVAGDGEWAKIMGSKKHAKGVQDLGEEQAPRIAVQPINDDAAYAYKPAPLQGRLTLFKPKVNYDFYPDPQMGWSDLVTGGLEIVELPVNPHAMLVEPFVQTLAEKLKDSIRRDSEESSSSSQNGSSPLRSKPQRAEVVHSAGSRH